jgi:hypothetical protein
MNKEYILRNPRERNAKKKKMTSLDYMELLFEPRRGEKVNFNITMIFFILNKNDRQEMTTLETAILVETTSCQGI